MIIIIYQTYENEIMETIIKTRKAFLNDQICVIEAGPGRKNFGLG